MYQTLKKFGKVRLNEPMAKHTTCKIGGPARFFVSVSTTTNLVNLLQFLDAEGHEYLILGGGSNMLPADEEFDGVVIRVKTDGLEIDGEMVMVEAGYTTAKLAHETVKAGLTGFEWGVGVPGTIGGAVRGNAGAMGKEMKDDVVKVEVYRNGEIEELGNEECEFGYRESVLKHDGGVVLRVWMKLEKNESKDGMMKALQVLTYRNETQPKGKSSSGCVFKNVELLGEQGTGNRELLLQHFDAEDEKVQRFLEVGKISAGWLIQEAGLKGESIGKATVSEVHGNFIVGEKGVTASEIKQLIEVIKERVYNTYGIELHEEIHLV